MTYVPREPSEWAQKLIDRAAGRKVPAFESDAWRALDEEDFDVRVASCVIAAEMWVQETDEALIAQRLEDELIVAQQIADARNDRQWVESTARIVRLSTTRGFHERQAAR